MTMSNMLFWSRSLPLVAVIALSQVGKSLRGSGNVNNPLETKSK